MSTAYDKETAFAELVRNYENLWVAIIDKDGVEFVVGAGTTAVEAINEAKAKGYPLAVLCKVPSFDSRFISTDADRVHVLAYCG
jgi:hypothetical protein